MGFQNISRDSTSEIIIQQIKRQITSGELHPGEKLPPERKLVELLGVSRTCIREAIQALAFSGYLKVIQGKGTFITETAPKYNEISKLFSKMSGFSLASLMEVRIMFEGEFARLAALRRTDNDLTEISNCFNEMKNAETIRIFFIKDLQFHLAIARATHNEVMNILMKIFGELLHHETNKILDFTSKSQQKTITITAKIVDAIKKRDSEEAKEFMIEHLKTVKATFGIK